MSYQEKQCSYGETKVERPHTIGCRVTQKELGQIDAIASAVGQSRSGWLLQLVKEALGETSVATVQAMEARLIALEKKLSRLAS